MVQQGVLGLPRALTAVQQAHTRWQAQLRAPLALLGLTVQQVVWEWPRALGTVQEEHIHWQV